MWNRLTWNDPSSFRGPEIMDGLLQSTNRTPQHKNNTTNNTQPQHTKLDHDQIQTKAEQTRVKQPNAPQFTSFPAHSNHIIIVIPFPAGIEARQNVLMTEAN